ncbi:hypothetical protein ACQJBY_022804 [Aegilops geniculata]
MSHVVDRCEDLLVILEIGLTVRRHAPPPDKQTTKHHGPNYRTEAEAARWPWQRSYGDLRWWPRQWRRFTVETNSGGNARWRLENGLAFLPLITLVSYTFNKSNFNGLIQTDGVFVCFLSV